MKISENAAARACRDLMNEFDKTKLTQTELCRFHGVDGYDVYNPSVPFLLNGKRYLAGRVEKRADGHSHIRFFEEKDGEFYAAESSILELQDPFVSMIGGKVILGGVSVEFFPDRCIWTTEFYEVKNLNDIRLVARGPLLMKDIRLVELRDGRLGVFTRPQGDAMREKYGCVAKIGFTIVDGLQDLNADVIAAAPLLDGQFLPDEWGGCNQVTCLNNGLLGIVGHIAYRTYEGTEQRLHYYGMTFCFDPNTRKASPVKLLTSRDCFPAAPSKRPDLTDVTFASGIERMPNGKAVIYSGLGDAFVGRAVIDDPFRDFEK